MSRAGFQAALCPCGHPKGWHEDTGCLIKSCGCKLVPQVKEKSYPLRLSLDEYKHLTDCIDIHLSHDVDEEPERAKALRAIQARLKTTRPR